MTQENVQLKPGDLVRLRFRKCAGWRAVQAVGEACVVIGDELFAQVEPNVWLREHDGQKGLIERFEFVLPEGKVA